MDIFSSGPNTGNLLVTVGLVAVLLVLSSRAKMLGLARSRERIQTAIAMEWGAADAA